MCEIRTKWIVPGLLEVETNDFEFSYEYPLLRGRVQQWSERY